MRYWVAVLLGSVGVLPAADLPKADNEEFERYTAQIEQALPGRNFTPERLAALRSGGISVEPSSDPNPRALGKSLIHDWTGAMFIRGGSLAGVLRVLQDFDNYKKIYNPEVDDSRLLSRNGDEYRSYLRLRKKKVLVVLLNTEYRTRFVRTSEKRAYSIAQSTKIAEVNYPGNGRERSPGESLGLLWRLNSYWNLEQREEGVYMECRAVSLTRDVPAGLSWMVAPMVNSLPRESLEATLASTGRAVGLVK